MGNNNNMAAGPQTAEDAETLKLREQQRQAELMHRGITSVFDPSAMEAPNPYASSHQLARGERKFDPDMIRTEWGELKYVLYMNRIHFPRE